MMRDRRGGHSRWVASLALCIASGLLCLLALEVAVRLVLPPVWHGPWANLALLQLNTNPVHSPHIRHDSVLGYEPIPGSSGLLIGRRIDFTPDGTRLHKSAAPQTGAPRVLVVGDSVTEGWEATNDETWPAFLEHDLEWPVLNAGVRGYGLDQIVLRAEKLAPLVDPSVIIVSFISDDVDRTTLAVRHRTPKPYFVASGQGLELRGVPVPQGPYREPGDSLRGVLGYSWLLDFVFRRLDLYDLWIGGDVRTRENADVIACRLMDRLAALARHQKVKILVVGLPSDPSIGDEAKRQAAVTKALACATRAGLATLDTAPGFAAAVPEHEFRALFFDYHFKAQGNRLAAGLIAPALRDLVSQGTEGPARPER